MAEEMESFKRTGPEVTAEDLDTRTSGDSGDTGKEISEPVEDSFLVNQPIQMVPVQKGLVIAGKYQLLEAIGEGGMGSVWLANQSGPVKRQVALKLIKIGLDSKRVVARFEAERQALAVMNHPNIAAIYDGGLTEFGTPFFVMERVHGASITRYCDENKLSIPERLKFFTTLCRAIHHAHQKGVIHRDIKPSNILVGGQGGTGHVKVIDFGVAKITDRSMLPASLDTGLGIIGTPHYMSPEQADLSSNDIDTRSDVYSLGVLLYELLTGTTPHRDSSKKENRPDVFELLERIREQDPVRPSTKIRDSELSSDIAERRRLPKGQLFGTLKNELDWIVMQALERERERRYESANAFADDIERYLGGDVVLAHPPSRSYRFKKFLARHKGPVLATFLVTASLVAGIVGTTWGMLESQKNEATAVRETVEKEAALREKEKQRIIAVEAKERAEEAEENLSQKASELLKVTGFQSRQLSNLNPQTIGARLYEDLRDRVRASLESRENDKENVRKRLAEFEGLLYPVNFTDVGVKLLEESFVDRAIDAMNVDFANQPTVLSSLFDTTSLTLESLGRYERAIELQNRTVAMRRELHGSEHAETISSILKLGYIYESANQLAEAEKQLREAVRLSRLVLGDDHPNTMIARGNLAGVLRHLGKLDEATELHQKVLKFEGNLPDDFSQELHELTQVNNQAALLIERNELAKAEQLLREAVDRATLLLGEEHPTTTIAMANLGGVLNSQGDLENAEVYYITTWENTRRRFGEDHPMTLTMSDRYGVLLWRMKRFNESVPHFEETVKLAQSVYESSDVRRQMMELNLAVNYRDAKMHDQAIQFIESLSWEALNPEQAMSFRRELFENILIGQYAEKGLPIIKEELANDRKTLPPDSSELAGKLAYHSVSCIRLGKWRQAVPLIEEALQIREREMPGTWQLAYTKSLLGYVRMQEEKFEEAETLLLQSVDSFGENRSDQLMSRWNEMVERLIQLYQKLGNSDEVERWRAELRD